MEEPGRTRRAQSNPPGWQNGHPIPPSAFHPLKRSARPRQHGGTRTRSTDQSVARQTLPPRLASLRSTAPHELVADRGYSRARTAVNDQSVSGRGGRGGCNRGCWRAAAGQCGARPIGVVASRPRRTPLPSIRYGMVTPIVPVMAYVGMYAGRSVSLVSVSRAGRRPRRRPGGHRVVFRCGGCRAFRVGFGMGVVESV
jgi:hypothetical protein